MSFHYNERIEILKFYDKYGLEPALDFVRHQGITISPATLYRWVRIRKLIDLGQTLTLHPKSTKPDNYRSSSYNPIYITLIQLIRKKRFRIGKTKLAKIIELARTDYSYASELSIEYSGNSKSLNLHALSPISASTIGRIIKDLKQRRSIARNAKEYNKNKAVYVHGWYWYTPSLYNN